MNNPETPKSVRVEIKPEYSYTSGLIRDMVSDTQVKSLT
jgi:hypothetical protein